MDAQPALAFDSFDPRLADFLLGPDSGLADGIAGYLGMRMVEVTPGRAVLELEARDELVHGFGALHGGVVAALIDQALGSAVLPLVPAGTWPATLEFKLNYLAAVRGGTVRATGQVIALRSRTAVVRVDVGNEGRAVATALGTISLNRPDPG